MVNRNRSIGHRVTNKIARLMIDRGLRLSNEVSGDFAAHRTRPKRNEDIADLAEREAFQDASAIVMQGPIAETDDFTYETLLLYRRNMPHCRLILSTWNDTPDAQLTRITELGVDIVLSDKPKVPGLYNINMQIVSASAGVKEAVSGGADWVLKTRTDQRLYEPNVIGFLIDLSGSFPPTGGFKQHSRIVGVGFGSLKFAPYHVTDQTVFGSAKDMLTYWSPPLREDPAPSGWPSDPREIYLTVPVGEATRYAAPESYFASQFLNGIGRDTEWTIEDSWCAYRDCFLFTDYNSTDFYWVKSQRYTVREYDQRYDTIWLRQEMNFAKWLLIHSGRITAEEAAKYEHALRTTFGSGELVRKELSG